ncbi:hypothetical protein ACFX2I_004143 [Malus domestica]|uniref:Uncharacterized protein n=1 Tax=Malus domestica TaxID=3750 RepID=A0A498IXQ6_MALDO|nr:hypothetical protein DVH24_021745 [Malus domestica]
MPSNPHVYDLCNFTSFSIRPHINVISGHLFDTRSFSIDRPSLSSVVFLFDFSTSSWDFIAPMLTPRRMCYGSKIESDSRHWQRISSHFFQRGWKPNELECENEFWVMDRYSKSRTISRVFPVDDHYRDVVVMTLKNGNGGCRWREVGDIWEAGKRMRLGKIVVVEDGDDCGGPAVFMLDGNVIFSFSGRCAEFFVGDDENKEFWVMDGYSESRTISRVFPVDEHYRDPMVMELKNGNDGCSWREVGDKWEAGERMRLAKLLSSKMAMITLVTIGSN